MKFLTAFAGFLILASRVSFCPADISLTLRNKQYIPPPIQDLPINEDYSNNQDNARQSSKFNENNYANSRYENFEVHRNYEPSSQEKSQNNNYLALPKISTEKTRKQHIKDAANYPSDDPNLDVSYLSLAASIDNSQTTNTVGYDATSNTPEPLLQTVQHNFPEKSNQEQQSADYLLPQAYSEHYSIQEKNLNNIASFKGPDYLPPIPQQGSPFLQQNSEFSGPNYLPPQEQQFSYQSNFKGSDYLPPERSIYQQAQENFEQKNTALKGSSNYLVPEQFNSDQLNTQFKGPEYLPPHQGHFVQQQNKEFRPNEQFNDFEYTPPYASVSNLIQAPRLPTGYDFEKPPNAPPAIEQFNDFEYTPPEQSYEVNSNTALKAPDYLLPHQLENNAAFKSPDHFPPLSNHLQAHQQQPPRLPTGYDFKKPPNAQQAIEELHKLPEEAPKPQLQQTAHQDSSNIIYGTQNYDFQKSQNSEKIISYLHSQVTPTNTQLLQTSDLPLPDYHFQGRDNMERTVSQILQVDASNQYLHPANDGAKNNLQNANHAKQTISLLHKTNLDQQNFKYSNLHQAQVQQANTNYHKTNYNPIFQPADQREAKQISKLASQTFKGPDYLPPTVGSTAFTGPEYLPPIGGPHSHPGYTHESEVFQGPNYLPPVNKQTSEVLDAPGYLPPVNKETSEVFKGTKNLHSVHKISSELFRAPAYLPPEKERTPQVFKAPDYLPPVDEQAPANKQIPEDFKRPNYLPPVKKPSSSEVFQGPDYLPPVKKQIPEAFQGPDYLPPVKEPSINAFQGPDYLPPVNKHNSEVFKGPDYLPPVKKPSNSEVFQGPEYLPPTNNGQSYQPQEEFVSKGSEYLPPTVNPTTQEVNSHTMYPLSSYMAIVNPYDRYGNRMAFLEYGLPPAARAAGNEIAPMYREPASRPKYYAPAISYYNSAFNIAAAAVLGKSPYQTTPTITPQAIQVLQTFMPEDVRQATPTFHYIASAASTVPPRTVQTTKTAEDTIRTVQIVNPNLVKTLRILESLDRSGVKTFKILGSTNEPIMGDHRIIKVVSGNQEQNVQTIKIFNDQQDATPVTNVGDGGNTYLPPRTKRDSNNKTKEKED